MSVNTKTLEKLRIAARLSQEGLANAAGVGKATIQRLEQTGHCSLGVLQKVAKALDIPAAVLLREEQ